MGRGRSVRRTSSRRLGETPLSVQWAWPGPLTYPECHETMKTFCCMLARAWTEFDVTGDRDMLSLTLYAARTSLSIGLVGVLISFILGATLGGISGYYGGRTDVVIQRVIEFIISIPTIPFWMALSAALPKDWPVIRVYFGITIILSLFGWSGLARVVRGKILELRGDDYVLAAKVAGKSEAGIIRKHLLPGFASYLIVHLTLAVPYMILAETSLSFLGLGLRFPP